MKNILIVTNADMSLQSGDVVLINRRSYELFKKFGIRTICICLNSKNDIKHNVDGVTYVKLEHIREIEKYINDFKPDKIIFYGVMVYKYIRNINNICTSKYTVLYNATLYIVC